MKRLPRYCAAHVELDNRLRYTLLTLCQAKSQKFYLVCPLLFAVYPFRFLRIGVLVAIVVYVVLDIAIDHPQNLVSVAGLIIYVLVFYVTSVNPAKVTLNSFSLFVSFFSTFEQCT